MRDVWHDHDIAGFRPSFVEMNEVDSPNEELDFTANGREVEIVRPLRIRQRHRTRQSHLHPPLFLFGLGQDWNPSHRVRG